MRRALLASLVALLFLAQIPPTHAVSYGTFGAKVLPSSTDFNPLYAALGTTPTICSRDTGVGGTASDDLYYLNIDGAGTTVAAFDVRLTTAGGFTAGTIVASSDTDTSQSFNGLACTAFEAKVGYVEADGLPGYTPGDEVVWSTDAVLGNGDIRLSTSTPQDGTAVTAGTYVAGTDADVSAFGNNNGLYPDCAGSPPTGAVCSGTAILGQGSFALRLFDANINGVLDTGDSLYLALSPSTTPNPASPNINDLYVYPGAGGTFGTKLARGSADYVAEPKVTFTTAPTLGTVGTASTCSPLIIHFGDALGTSSPFVVQMDDVVLYSTTSSCASPQPASSITAGTRVAGTTQSQGTAFTAAPVALAGLIYYVDVNGNSYLDSADPVYLHRPASLGGTGASPPATGIVAGDLRLTAVTAGASSFAAGTIVGGTDADIGSFTNIATNVGSGTQSWFVRLINNDDASETPLTAASLIKYNENSNPVNLVWDPTTDPVYVDADSSGTVTAGDIRLSKGGAGLIDYSALADGPAQVVLVSDADVGKVLTASSDFKVSGGDATFDTGRAESVYFSKDGFVNNEDYRIQKSALSSLAAKAQVVCGTNDCLDEGVHASDQLQFSWCVTANSCFGRLQVNDLQVSPTLGTRQTSTPSADFVPTLKALPTDGGTLLRQNLGDSTSVTDDTFYISGSSTTAVTTSAIRITPLIAQSKAAGTFVVTGDAIDMAAGATASTVTAASLIAYRDTDGLTGYTLNDVVYMDLKDPPVTGATSGSLTVNDVRLSTQSSLSVTAGTFVLPGNADLQAGTNFGSGAFTLAYFDDNQNGVFDNGDMLYAIPPSPASTSQPVVGAVYIAGPGGSTSSGTSGGGGGGGGGGVATTTTTAPTTALSSSSSSSSSAAPTTAADGTLGGFPEVVAANQALKASLKATPSGDGVLLTWTAQDGITGYQVWGHGSPYVLLATLNSAAATSYSYNGKEVGFLVTAFHGADGNLTAAQINAGQIPGLTAGVIPYGAVASSASSSSSKKGPIPGPELALLVGAVGVALLLARRRLA